MKVNVRRYIEGQLIGALPPAELPPTPWRDPPPPAPKRPYRMKKPRRDKWGLWTLADVGQSLTVPIGSEPASVVGRRVSVAIAQRKLLAPERFSMKTMGDRIRVTRTA